MTRETLSRGNEIVKRIEQIDTVATTFAATENSNNYVELTEAEQIALSTALAAEKAGLEAEFAEL